MPSPARWIILALAVAAPVHMGAQAVPASPQSAAAPAPPPDMRMRIVPAPQPGVDDRRNPETTRVNQGHQANIDRLTKEGADGGRGTAEGPPGIARLPGFFLPGCRRWRPPGPRSKPTLP